jgi:hypothetical protein
MTEIRKETTTVQQMGPTAAVTTVSKSVATSVQTLEYLIYFVLGIVEILLVFRLVLKLLGASLASGFVQFVYGLTGVMIAPFAGIFRTGDSQGMETRSILEPATLVALIVYAVLAGGIVKLTRILSRERQDLGEVSA